MIFLIALFFRLYKLNETEIYPDEITWTVRSRESFLAIKTGNFDYFKDAWWNKSNDTEAINLPTAIISGAAIFFLAKGQPTHYSLNMLPDYLAARIPIIFLTSIFAAIFYFIAKKITKNSYIALLSALLISLDPTSIALSRWSLADFPLTIWMSLSLTSFFLIKRNKLSIALSAFFACLAFLTKPTGLIVFIPFIVFSPKKSLISIVLFLIFTKFLWLGQNQNIFFEIYSYFIRQLQLSNTPFLTFFQGKITGNPPFYYYLQQIFTRLLALPIILFLVYPFVAKKIKFKQSNFIKVIIPTFMIIYLIILSIPAKKLGVRYIFPIIPWVYLYSAISAYEIIIKFKTKYHIFFYSLIFGSIVFATISYFPNYYLYRNVFVCKLQNFQEKEVLGLCMGVKSSLEYIHKNYPTIRSIAYLGCSKTTIPYYSSLSISTDWKQEKLIVVEESLTMLSPELEAVQYYKNKKPIYINSWRGIVLSRIYYNN